MTIIMKRAHRTRRSLSHLLLVMKLIALLIFLNITSVIADGKAQIINLSAKDLTLIEVLEIVKKQSGYGFFLNNRNLANMKLNATIKNQPLTGAIDQLLSGLPVEWVLQNNTIIIKPRHIQNGVFADKVARDGIPIPQQQTVAGKVVNEAGRPLLGVTVRVLGTDQVTNTDANGSFKLRDVTAGQSLELSMIGFQTVTISAAPNEAIEIILKEHVDNLDEVVVVGYGTQRKADLTGAVQSLSSKEILRRTTSSASVALQGMIPGLSAVQSSGQPGADNAAIKIRGTGSLNSATSPLVLIDGVEGDMNRIDLNSVESISVLKDAASASIYGSRASNGVILITTKRGKEGEVKIGYNGYMGNNTPTLLPEPVGAVDFMEAMNLASTNADQDIKYTQDQIDIYRSGGADNTLYYDTNWKEEVLKKSAFLQNHSVTLSGGNKQARFFASAGHVYQDGQIKENNFSRTNVRLNTDTEIRDWLKAGIDVNIRHSQARRPVMETPANIIGYALTMNPLLSGRNADGSYGYGINGINPIALAEAGGVRNDIAPELGLRTFVDITPFKGFDISGSYSYRKLDSEMNAFVYPYDMYEGGASKGSFPSSGSSRAEERSQSLTKQFNLLTSYQKTLGSHYLKAMVGMQTEETTYKMVSARRENFIIKEYNEIFNGDPGKMSNSGNRYDSALLSYLFRINYSYDNKYLLELSGRYDGSSRFINENRWGFFPSASAGWKVSEEDFFAPLKNAINTLKIRGSYGLLGNQSISGYYPYTSLISSGINYYFNKELVSGASQAQLANEQIAWEKSEQYNIGLDLGLFNDRLSLTFDYYKRNISDMLQRFDLAYFVGMTAPWENAGLMRNKGWDLSLNWRGQSDHFSYYITGNLSDVRNKVINLYGNEYLGSHTITREGDPYSSYFGYVSDGLFQSQQEIDDAPAVYGGKKENVRPGYIRYKDLNGDHIIDTEDRTIIGDPSPRYEYSFTLGGDWKGLDVSLFFQGVGKRDMFYTGPGARPLFGANTTLYKHQLDSWSEDNREAKFPILLNDVSGTGSNNIVSDYWIRQVSYLRLKNLVIGYTLPKSWTDKATIQNARIYFSGQNLFTKSNAMEGYDPENSISNGNYYPLMKTLNFGLNLDF